MNGQMEAGRAPSHSARDESAEDIAALRARLHEAEETLEAIRNGDVDAVVVGGPSGQLVYTLENADRPYRVLIEQMQEGAVTLNEDGTVLYCNQRFASMVGEARETVLGGAIHRFFQIDDIAMFERMLLGREGTPRTSEFLIGSAHRQTTPVNISLVDLKIDDEFSRVICGVFTDLTNNRLRTQELGATNTLLEQEIKERRRIGESLQLALDAAGMGDWEIDLATGQARFSDRYDQIFGRLEVDRQQDLSDLLETFIPRDRDVVGKAFACILETNVIALEGRILREQDQVVRWVDLRGRVYYDGATPVRIAGVVSDITQHRAVEEQLRQAQKMEAVGQLTGGLAHDFNNLLTGITGSLELLQRRTAQGRPGVELERYIAAAQNAAKRAAGLTHRLLAFARRQTLDPHAIDVNRLIREMEELLRRTIGPACELRVELANDLWTALVDGNQLESALLNLCINARDALPDGGRIRVQTENLDLDFNSATEYEVPSGHYLSITVADNGIGMSEATVARAFDPFFTTKPIGAGTGLGLSMVYGFTRQSKGHARITSRLGHGTEIRILLPRVTDAVHAEVSVIYGLESSITKHHETVLVVDDEPTVRMLILEVLDDLGYDAIEAEDGKAALEVLQSSRRIDLLITDVGLPGALNGRQVADAARVTRPSLRILFITGYADSAVLDNSHLSEGMETLTKPFTLDMLAHRIGDLVSSHC